MKLWARTCLFAVTATLVIGSSAQAMPLGRVADVAVLRHPSNAERIPFAKALSVPRTASSGVWLAPAAATTKPKPCDDDPSFLCGTVAVPIDRAHPQGRHLDIAYQVFPHTHPTVTLTEPIFVATGGPGASGIGDRYAWAYYILPGLTTDHDLVIVDQRGTGGSGAIHCPDLQDGWNSGPAFYRATRRCAARLGDDADRYGSGDIAMDIDDVRAALGYDVIDYFAVSYGTVVEQAYASRYPDHLRAIVADGGTPVTDPEHAWGWGLDQPKAHVRAAVLSCERAPACIAVNPDPEALFDGLVDRLAVRPVVGRGRDANGVRHHVVVDEFTLGLLSFDNLNDAELTAAAAALLQHDDPAPLLRLGAEMQMSFGPDPVSFYSEGAHEATTCNDQDFVFDRNLPRAVRRQQYLDAKAALPPETFAPWHVQGWDSQGWLGVCTEWPSPDRFVPAVPANAVPIDVPTLILEGDIDTDVPLETNERLAELFADPVVVTVQGAAHTSTVFSQCARDITAAFLSTLAVGDTSCTQTPSTVFPAQTAFAVTAAAAPEATRASNSDRSKGRDRRAAWSATRTVIDAWLRSFRQPEPIADGAGLRGGTFRADYASADDHAKISLVAARFVKDIAVTGRSTMSYDQENPLMQARIVINGTGTDHGVLKIAGVFWFDTFFGPLHVTGRIGGRHIDVTLPAN